MKIRIKGNSIRFRLTKPEVEQFKKEGYVEERTEFVNSTFVYVLQNAQNIKGLTASFVGQTLTMFVPSNITEQWTTTNAIGFENNLNMGHGGHLFLLLEKDFKCIDGKEDQSDNYEHPIKNC